jgi:metal-responsive CopG/Arc/MetJ family transcriptional regulator
MSGIYNGLGTADREAVDKLAAEHKLDKNILAIAVLSGHSDAIKVLTSGIKSTVDAAVKEAKAAAKGGGSGGGDDNPPEKKKDIEAKIQKYQEQYDKAVANKNHSMMITYRNRLQAAVNDLKALMA